MGSCNLGPQLPEGKLEDFEVELDLKQPVPRLVTPTPSQWRKILVPMCWVREHEHPSVAES